jgi:hypothetical protein
MYANTVAETFVLACEQLWSSRSEKPSETSINIITGQPLVADSDLDSMVAITPCYRLNVSRAGQLQSCRTERKTITNGRKHQLVGENLQVEAARLRKSRTILQAVLNSLRSGPA